MVLLSAVPPYTTFRPVYSSHFGSTTLYGAHSAFSSTPPLTSGFSPGYARTVNPDFSAPISTASLIWCRPARNTTVPPLAAFATPAATVFKGLDSVPGLASAPRVGSTNKESVGRAAGAGSAGASPLISVGQSSFSPRARKSDSKDPCLGSSCLPNVYANFRIPQSKVAGTPSRLFPAVSMGHLAARATLGARATSTRMLPGLDLSHKNLT
mmetsp:Transcript_11963/g.27291  ORF Transcript_11963/g.27291 Transcript_11963/m.27291 type:complete len:211 (-) Transcript_11963:8-640(-)